MWLSLSHNLVLPFLAFQKLNGSKRPERGHMNHKHKKSSVVHLFTFIPVVYCFIYACKVSFSKFL